MGMDGSWICHGAMAAALPYHDFAPVCGLMDIIEVSHMHGGVNLLLISENRLVHAVVRVGLHSYWLVYHCREALSKVVEMSKVSLLWQDRPRTLSYSKRL